MTLQQIQSAVAGADPAGDLYQNQPLVEKFRRLLLFGKGALSNSNSNFETEMEWITDLCAGISELS